MNSSNSATSQVLPMEKIVAIASYISCGFVGFIWLLIGIIKKQNLRPFLQFHIYQSIFLSLIFSIIFYLWNHIKLLLWIIPGINKLLGLLSAFLTKSIVLKFSIINICAIVFLFYLCQGAFRGKYTYVPWVSEIINYNTRR